MVEILYKKFFSGGKRFLLSGKGQFYPPHNWRVELSINRIEFRERGREKTKNDIFTLHKYQKQHKKQKYDTIHTKKRMTHRQK